MYIKCILAQIETGTSFSHSTTDVLCQSREVLYERSPTYTQSAQYIPNTQNNNNNMNPGIQNISCSPGQNIGQNIGQHFMHIQPNTNGMQSQVQLCNGQPMTNYQSMQYNSLQPKMMDNSIPQ